MVYEDNSLTSILRKIDFLADADDACINKIVKELIEVSFEADECILKEGRQGGSFFFLLEGSVSIWSGECGETKKIAMIEAPSYFGELALLHGKNRNATIKTESQVNASMLCREAFKELILGNPKLKKNLIKFSEQRLKK